MPATMKALVLDAHGPLDDLRLAPDHAVPEVTPGHVLVRVTAASFNHHDIFTVRGMPGIMLPLPVIIGLDMAGEVAEVGDGVEGWAPGDRAVVVPLASDGHLMGEMHDGGMAQYCLVEAEQLVRLPDEVSDVQAAALPVAYGAAHRMMVGKGAVHAGC